jgi:hypothetical protein
MCTTLQKILHAPLAAGLSHLKAPKKLITINQESLIAFTVSFG